ncbi:MAG TPA: SRPBCC family protein [Solirubrobacteraceae bacterium]
MSSWTHETRCHGTPDDVLTLLTDAEAIARWSPVPFELVGSETRRLRAGDRVRVRGGLGGHGVEFVVQVGEACDGRLSLRASGPIDIDVEYVARPADEGSHVRAQIAVAGNGLRGRLLASATDALLAAGALRASMARIARELEPAFG